MPQNQPSKATFFQSFQKLIRSFGYAFNGIKHATLTELNFRIHLVATLLTVLAGYALHIDYHEWLWVGLCITLVLVTELLNTAIERLTDLVSPNYHPIAGHVKDIAAGAVTVMTLFALITGCVIFLPKLIKLIHHAA
jgi:diacylglycerol kinase (ATP)